MAYVIYNTKTFQRYKTARRTSSWSQLRSAKSVLTKAIKSGEITGDDWRADTIEAFDAAEPMVTVKNCLSGTEVQIRASERGNPACDPSMEGFHTM